MQQQPAPWPAATAFDTFTFSQQPAAIDFLQFQRSRTFSNRNSSGSSSSNSLATLAFETSFALTAAPILSCLGLGTLPLATPTPLALTIFSEAVSCLKFSSHFIKKFRFQILALTESFALTAAPILSCLGLGTLPLATSAPLESAIFSEAVSCSKFSSHCIGKFRFQILALPESLH